MGYLPARTRKNAGGVAGSCTIILEAQVSRNDCSVVNRTARAKTARTLAAIAHTQESFGICLFREIRSMLYVPGPRNRAGFSGPGH